MRSSVVPASLTVLMISLTAFVEARSQSMMDQMIISQCTAAMQNDFAKAGKTPPAGMIDKTCNCVVQTLNQTHNLDYAKKSCTQQAKQSQSSSSLSSTISR